MKRAFNRYTFIKRTSQPHMPELHPYDNMRLGTALLGPSCIKHCHSVWYRSSCFTNGIGFCAFGPYSAAIAPRACRTSHSVLPDSSQWLQGGS
jgi:hypothetical protein